MIAPSPGTAILYTKLNRPAVGGSLVNRPHLHKLLNLGLEGSLTLVIAPAGFGKTTLISAWLDNLPLQANQAALPAAWLSLDKGDSDLSIFLRYFIAALRTIFPEACPETLDLLDAINAPDPALLFTTFSNEIARLPSRFIMVLDDLHTLRNPAIFDLFSVWLRHWPGTLHLIILSRVQPSLPLADLRAKGQITEIRSRDLRFSLAESGEYLRPGLEALLDQRTILLLQERMEGWIAGLKLAALSLMRHDDPQAFTQDLIQGDVYIADYLLDQVLRQQSPLVQQFLLAAAIPDRFCASLAAALLNGRYPTLDTQTLMDEIEATDLFITALDNRREWYRFHDLFRNFLRQSADRLLPAAELQALHSRAAIWYSGHDLTDQALHHALLADDLDLVAQVMQQGLNRVLNREDRPTLERWRRLLPDPLIQSNPQLLLLEAWETIFHWDFARMEQLVSRATKMLEERADQIEPDQGRLLRGQLAVFKGLVAHHTNCPEESLAYCQEALALLPDSWRYARGVALSYLGLCLHTIGRVAEAEAYLLDQYQLEKDRPDSYTLRILLALAINDIKSGYLERAERAAQVIWQKARENQLVFLESWSHTSLGTIYYLWDELALAEQHFAELVRLRFATFLTLSRKGMSGLALTYQAQGKSAAALEAIEQASLFDVEMIGQEAVETAAARARLMSLQGNAENAERWADQFAELPPNRPLYPTTEEPYMTRARILIWRGRPEDIQAALRLLETLAEIAEHTYTDRSKVEILALRALAELACGEEMAAQQSLIASVTLARRGQIIRVFVDLGPRMRALLQQIADHEPVAKSVQRILAAFPAEEGEATAVPDEPLTLREQEILALLAQRLSAKEIAAQLVISLHTVKRHRANIYQKLGVNRLRDALVVVEDLGLLNGR